MIKRWTGTDPVAWKRVMDGIKMGMPERVICAGAGMSEATLRNWLEDGKDEFENGEETVKAQFYADVCEARAWFVADCLKNGREARGNWFEWLLGKRMPRDFGEGVATQEDAGVTLVIDAPAEKVALPPSAPVDTPKDGK